MSEKPALSDSFLGFHYYPHAFCVACEARMAHRDNDSGGGVVVLVVRVVTLSVSDQ